MLKKGRGHGGRIINQSGPKDVCQDCLCVKVEGAYGDVKGTESEAASVLRVFRFGVLVQ